MKTSTLNIYLHRHSAAFGTDLHAADQAKLAGTLTYLPDSVQWVKTDPDYMLVGTADVTINLMSRVGVVQNAVAILRKQQLDVQAAAAVRAQQIEQQINNLLCIEGSAVEVTE